MIQETQNPQLNIPVISGSALIANFMYPNAKNEYANGEIEIEDGIYKKATLMKYHSSWDWLMPVYRKIRDIINERSKYDKHTRTNYDLLELDIQMVKINYNGERMAMD